MTLQEAYTQLKDSEDPAIQLVLKAAIVHSYLFDLLIENIKSAEMELSAL